MARTRVINLNEIDATQPVGLSHQRLLDLAATQFINDGTWPTLSNLKRDCARRGDPLTYNPVNNPLPESLGFIGMGAPQAVTLNVAGLARCEVARPFLDDLVRFAQYSYRVFLSDLDPPRVTSAAVKDDLGMSEATIVRIGTIMPTEPYLNSGWRRGPENPIDWSCELDDAVLELKNIKTVDALVATRTRLLRPRSRLKPSSEVTLAPPEATISHTTPNFTVLDLEHMHPAISGATASLLTSGHPEQAVLDAAIAFLRLLRTKAGLSEDIDGTPLVEQGFKKMPVAAERPAKLQREAIKHIAVGDGGALPEHDGPPADQLDRDEAAEAIATFSLLCRRIDSAFSEAPLR